MQRKGKMAGAAGALALVGSAVLGAVGAAPAGAVFPGHDGRIAYELAGDIYTVKPDGTGTLRLTTSANNSNPRWSKDGKKLAFERAKNIFTMNADGSGVKQITTTGKAHEPSWSPDGTTLVFANIVAPSNKGDLFTVSSAGGPITRITFDAGKTCGDGRPTWSPQGNLIAFHQCTLPDGGNAIRTVNPTSHAQKLVIKEIGADHPDWRPGGVKIIYMAACLDAAGTECPPSANPVEIKPDGTGRTSIFLSVGAEGSAHIADVCSAPDGSQMAVTETSTDNFDIAIYQRNTVLGQTLVRSRMVVPHDCDWQAVP